MRLRINFRYRSDIAVKVFGEDLDVLARKAREIKKAINKVEPDIIIEKRKAYHK
jgi:cobalt-zinc-cadmium resistance protein CzcA